MHPAYAAPVSPRIDISVGPRKAYLHVAHGVTIGEEDEEEEKRKKSGLAYCVMLAGGIRQMGMGYATPIRWTTSR